MGIFSSDSATSSEAGNFALILALSSDEPTGHFAVESEGGWLGSRRPWIRRSGWSGVRQPQGKGQKGTLLDRTYPKRGAARGSPQPLPPWNVGQGRPCWWGKEAEP